MKCFITYYYILLTKSDGHGGRIPPEVFLVLTERIEKIPLRCFNFANFMGEPLWKMSSPASYKILDAHFPRPM